MKPLITELTKARDIYIELNRKKLNPPDEFSVNGRVDKEK